MSITAGAALLLEVTEDVEDVSTWLELDAAVLELDAAEFVALLKLDTIELAALLELDTAEIVALLKLDMVELAALLALDTAECAALLELVPDGTEESPPQATRLAAARSKLILIRVINLSWAIKRVNVSRTSLIDVMTIYYRIVLILICYLFY